MMRNMTRKKKLIFIAPLAGLGMALIIFIGGEVVMHLWNWNLPPLFGWREITFWQALGLFALCRILFGGSGPLRSGRSNIRRRISERMDERWAHMTPEERERFRQGMRGRCGMDYPGSEAGSGSDRSTGESKGQ
jgi:hypothetical protein